MPVTANVISKWEAPWGLDVTVSYTCPHCGETVTETISFGKGLKNCVASMEDYESIRELVFAMLQNMKAEV